MNFSCAHKQDLGIGSPIPTFLTLFTAYETNVQPALQFCAKAVISNHTNVQSLNRKSMKLIFCLLLISISYSGNCQQDGSHRIVFGCNFIPSTAINQLEMWQAETFDTATISKELQWAASIGMNTVRVFLHDLAYKEDPAGFLERMDVFLSIANRYHIKTLFVFFDSCWDPYPTTGKQPEPTPFRHNSHWVQSPGANALKDAAEYPRLETYVKAVVKRFAADQRVFGWDVWNEPENGNEGTYSKVELPNKNSYVLKLMRQAFGWARSQHAKQPLTSAVWKFYENWTPAYQLDSIEKVQVENSDILSFHYYGKAADLEKRIVWLQQFGKQIVCTEYLARSYGSTFETSLPVFVKYAVGAMNWGLVSGKTQTIYPWQSWSKAFTSEPAVWHHDIFKKDGIPYREKEVDFIKSLMLMTERKVQALNR
jgi:hypothetical protein